MNSTKSPLVRPTALLAAGTLLTVLTGCSKPLTDAQLTANVQAALKADTAISQQPINVAVDQGVATLTGNVSDDTANDVAARDAATVKGIKEVVDQLTVSGIQVAPTVVSPAAPTQPRQTTPQERQIIAQGRTLPPPTKTVSEPAAPPAPVTRSITAPVGTSIPVRITESISSQTATDGQPFNGTITYEVVHDGYVILPAGTAVSGHVVFAKDAGRFKGHSAISIELTAARRHGSLINLSTDAYTLEGKNRGTNTAEKIGGGAAIGAILGGIFGGGKGAGIGALAGGGGGTILQGVTHGQQVTIPSESLIRFHLAQPLTIQTSQAPSNYDPTTLHER